MKQITRTRRIKWCYRFFYDELTLEPFKPIKMIRVWPWEFRGCSFHLFIFRAELRRLRVGFQQYNLYTFFRKNSILTKLFRIEIFDLSFHSKLWSSKFKCFQLTVILGSPIERLWNNQLFSAWKALYQVLSLKRLNLWNSWPKLLWTRIREFILHIKNFRILNQHTWSKKRIWSKMKYQIFLSNDLYHLPTTACDIFGIITKKTIEIQMFRLLMKETYTVSSTFKMKNMLSLQLKVVRDRRI